MSPEEKIEAAQKLIDEARVELTAMREKAAAPRNWPEWIDAGMVFRHRGGAVYVWAHDRCQELVCLVAGGESRCGDVFDKDLARVCMDSFSYLGHARDLIKIADDAHEPTGAELVGMTTEYEIGPDDVIEASDDMCRNGHSERCPHNWRDSFPHGITVKDARNQCKSAIRFFRKAVR